MLVHVVSVLSNEIHLLQSAAAETAAKRAHSLSRSELQRMDEIQVAYNTVLREISQREKAVEHMYTVR